MCFFGLENKKITAKILSSSEPLRKVKKNINENFQLFGGGIFSGYILKVQMKTWMASQSRKKSPQKPFLPKHTS